VSDIFLSYARADRPVAQFLAQALERSGFTVFWDRDLVSGDDFEQVIGVELVEARAVVVLWSSSSVKSGWCRDEAASAMERHALVPVQLNGTPPPIGFRSIHTIPFDYGEPAELLRAVVRLTVKVPKVALSPMAKRTGLGLLEAACLLVLLAAVLFLLVVLPRWR
jgi:hypothetical protein